MNEYHFIRTITEMVVVRAKDEEQAYEQAYRFSEDKATLINTEVELDYVEEDDSSES